MNMRRNMKILCRMMLSGGLAFLILTCFCFFYFNLPPRCEEQSGATDYRWSEKTFYSRWTEGVSWGSTNNEGYTDSIDHLEGEKVDVLLMGSSHLEGFQVPPEDRLAARVRMKNPEKSIYSIGISGHSFLICCCNLNTALDKYEPSEAVVIETGSVWFSDSELNGAVNGSLNEISAFSNGLIGFLQKNPFLRLLYSQFQGYRKTKSETPFFPQYVREEQSQAKDLPDSELLGMLLRKINGIAQGHQVQLIVIYHPAIGLSADGSVQRKDDPKTVRLFEQICVREGILFCDMGERFLSEYMENHVLPYGFFNTSVGSGHLNRYGLEMMAEELSFLLGEGKV